MQQDNYQKKINQNRQLIIAYKQVQRLEESCWAQLFRFQKTLFFVNFEKNQSVPHVLSLRLDDFIYLILLMILQIIFGLLPLNNELLETPYRHSLGLFFITSFITFISKHWFKWLTLTIICIFYPVLIFLTFNGYINLMPLDNSTSIYNYMGYLTLVPIYVFLLIIYPIKQYIRNSIGSLYSYIYGLSITLILYLWPLYSFISSSSFNLNFITQNKPLIISFIIVLITGFYIFIHNILFQMNIQTIKQLLLKQFTQGELVTVLQDFQENIRQKSCIQQNFILYTKSLSFLLYLMMVGSQIYLYLLLAEDLTKIIYIAPIMAYLIIFTLIGAFLVYINVSKEVLTPIMMILSLSSAFPSISYYNSQTNFQIYALVSMSCPFIATFWSLINFIPANKPIFKINAIIVCYITLYIPMMMAVMNTLQIFTTDTGVISSINFTIYSVVSAFIILALIIFLYREIQKRKKQFPQEEQKKKIPVDYNYFEEGDPKYEYYKISKQFGLGYLQKIDIREIGYIFLMIVFILAMLMSIHAINKLNTSFATTVFFIQSIKQIIYAQLYINFIFYIYSHIYLINSPNSLSSYVFGIYFIISSSLFLLFGFIISSMSTFLKILGGIGIIMLLVVIGLQKIKSFSQKIFNFVSPIIVISLQLFIILPFAQIMPFATVFADQDNFGEFIYICILISAVLIIVLVGILTFIFNRFIDKYEQQKKFKFMIEDVNTLLEEQGVDCRDQQLHILYQSFIFRDKKYVFFLKKGYPVNLLKDPEDQVTKLVSSQDYQLSRAPTKRQLRQKYMKQKSCLWRFLTCCCGQDDEQINQKIKKAKHKIDPQEFQRLIPSSLIPGLIKQNKIQPKKIKKKIISSAKTFSTKSLILKNMHAGPRYLSDEYILLKTNKKIDLAIEVWHNIFDFIANTDQGQPLIIQNDLKMFLQFAQIDLPPNDITQLFSELATKKWGDTFAIDLQKFAFFIQDISYKLFKDSKIPPEQLKYNLLTQKVYYNLSIYEQFNNFIIQQKVHKRISKEMLQKSPFTNSYLNYRKQKQLYRNQQQKYINRLRMQDKNRLFEDDKIERQYEIKEQDVIGEKQREKGKSCKLMIYDAIVRCQNCCKNEDDKDEFERKLFVKSWKILSVQAVKILQRKQNEWDSNAESNKEHQFRISSNNLLIAAFKLLDIYSYISVSIFNPFIEWLPASLASSSNLFFNYYIQHYIAAGIVLISIPLSIKGIMLIFQDRLGLTQTRLTAKFPHPMYLFTFIYKLLILSLFGIISQTFLTSFSCNWLQAGNKFVLYDDKTIQCFSQNHIYFMLISIVSILLYYPLSSYAMPNFQFAEKDLDLKYRTSYLIIYFQVQFVLIANKILVNAINSGFIVQIVYNSINIGVLFMLAFIVIKLKPCLIQWFNYVQLLVISIGITVNIFGLILYITKSWLICVISVIATCLIILVVAILYIRANFFKSKSNDIVEQQVQKVNELQMMWIDKQKRQKRIIQFQQIKNDRRYK